MKKVFIIVVLIIYRIHAFGQITIGSNIKPNDGALLDLKEIDSDGANSSKGLELAKVALIASDNLLPCAPNNLENRASHIGLIVYNTATIDILIPGLYHWTGSRWEELNAEGVRTLGPWYSVDTKKPSKLNTDNVYVMGKVAIGTDTPTEDAQLTVKGNSVFDGQIILGYNDVPLPGSLLDIRTQADEDPTNGGVNSDKGITLPRVQLESVTSLAPLLPGGDDPNEHKAHKALVVYHIGGNGMDSGLKIWDGSKWLGMITELPPPRKPEIKTYKMLRVVTTLPYDGAVESMAQGVRLPFGEVGKEGGVTMKIPTAGSYAFSFRFYGEVKGAQNGFQSVPFYLTAMKYKTASGVREVADSQEIRILISSSLMINTYTANSVVLDCEEGDEIYFLMSHITPNTRMELRMAASDKSPINTTVLLWSL